MLSWRVGVLLRMHDNNKDQGADAPGFSGRADRRAQQDTEKYFNGQFDAAPRLIEPGQVLCSGDAGEMFVATVGSGVLVTVHDTGLKIGAMGYVLIPPVLLDAFPFFSRVDKKWMDMAAKPMEDCIAEMKRRGAGKHRLQVRLIGGAMMPGQVRCEDAGTKNFIFVREYIARKGLSVLNEDLGGPYVRRVHYFPSTGRAVRMMLRRASDFSTAHDFESRGRE